MSLATLLPPPKTEYEGAGVTLMFGENFILGIRKYKNDSPENVPEVEYQGGKPEPEDGGDPRRTAISELTEEVGGEFLDADWDSRCEIIHCFQPISKRWIWNYVISLNPAEYERLVELNRALDQWDNDE